MVKDFVMCIWSNAVYWQGLDQQVDNYVVRGRRV